MDLNKLSTNELINVFNHKHFTKHDEDDDTTTEDWMSVEKAYLISDKVVIVFGDCTAPARYDIEEGRKTMLNHIDINDYYEFKRIEMMKGLKR